MIAKPKSQQNCQLVNHYDYAKGALKLLADLRLEANKFWNSFYKAGPTTVSEMTEKDVTKRLTSIYNDLEKLVKSVDVRRPDSLPLHTISNIHDGEISLPIAGCLVDEQSYRECVERAAAFQEFAQGYFDSSQRQEVAHSLRNMNFLGPEKLRVFSVEKMHSQFLAVLKTLRVNAERLVILHKWRVSSVVEMPFLETMIEVEFGRLRDALFVSQLKAVLVIRQGELVSVSIGSPNETLWKKDDDVSSQHEVFQKMTSLAFHRLFSTYSHTKMISFQTVSMVFSFLQLYTLSFSLPCCGCHKVMRDYLPPMVLTDFNQIRPRFFHENCLV
ncbi:hypothetical protein RB195_013664 [Necator americanus]